MEVKGAEIAFSPGFRWGTTILPDEPITLEDVMNQTAITYPYTTLTEMTGETIKGILEDVCDNLFNPYPYKQQGGDMARVGGMTYTCGPTASKDRRISGMMLGGNAIEPGKKYQVASWAPVAEGASGQPVWKIVTTYLRRNKVIRPPRLNLPRLTGIAGNPGITVEG